jgi:hypothetical protein
MLNTSAGVVEAEAGHASLHSCSSTKCGSSLRFRHYYIDVHTMQWDIKTVLVLGRSISEMHYLHAPPHKNDAAPQNTDYNTCNLIRIRIRNFGCRIRRIGIRNFGCRIQRIRIRIPNFGCRIRRIKIRILGYKIGI